MSERVPVNGLVPNIVKEYSTWHTPRSSDGSATYAQAFNNLFTGNLDFDRSLALSAYANEFSRSEREAAQAFNAYQAELDRNFQASEATKAYNRSKAEAQLQRDYEERLSNTAYQRAVDDMKKAGINPYAMYGHGTAASTPSGAAGNAYAASGSRASSAGFGRGTVGVFQGRQSAFISGAMNALAMVASAYLKMPAPITKNYHIYR